MLQSDCFWDVFASRVNLKALNLFGTSLIRTKLAMELIAKLRGVPIRDVNFNDKGVTLLSGKTLSVVEKLLTGYNPRVVADLIDVRLDQFPSVHKSFLQLQQECNVSMKSTSDTLTFVGHARSNDDNGDDDNDNDDNDNDNENELTSLLSTSQLQQEHSEDNANNSIALGNANTSLQTQTRSPKKDIALPLHDPQTLANNTSCQPLPDTLTLDSHPKQ
ncbi:hypothetical protein RFI_33356 [Reticulomyxa filosa]|uniref:Uncharacterized protein n=1 Tax=Reticulomyxa filosa TaxID=46433 RepID=X6LRL2_RETFI|nr:hypothetical protein RFI_33356 [Reticulomyxa filosa]|eukprot:ETO04046.1 hypothetical protein RFI_33356 [Reticulomyxa filosa]